MTGSSPYIQLLKLQKGEGAVPKWLSSFLAAPL